MEIKKKNIENQWIIKSEKKVAFILKFVKGTE